MYTKTQPLNDKCITKYEWWCTIVKWGIIHIVYSFTELLFRSKTSLIKTERNHICGAISTSLQLINAPWYTRVTIENESKCEKKRKKIESSAEMSRDRAPAGCHIQWSDQWEPGEEKRNNHRYRSKLAVIQSHSRLLDGLASIITDTTTNKELHKVI